MTDTNRYNSDNSRIVSRVAIPGCAAPFYVLTTKPGVPRQTSRRYPKRAARLEAYTSLLSCFLAGLWGGSSRAARFARGAAALRQRARQRLAINRYILIRASHAFAKPVYLYLDISRGP